MGTMRFILGRAGSGKTRYCLDQVVRRLRESPLAGPAVILLVPEQATFQMSRMLAEWRGGRGFIRGRVLSFRSLAQLGVGAEGGQRRPMLDFSRKLVMQQLLTTVQGELKFWKDIRPERIALGVLQLLDELTLARLGPEELETRYRKLQAQGQLDKQTGDKLSDVARLYKEYLKMDLVGLDDPLAYLDRYRKGINQIEWLKGASIYADGFSGFTGQQYAALMATIQVAKETAITLTLDPDQLGKPPILEELSSFWPNEQTYFRLLNLAKGAGIAVGKSVVLDSSMRRRYRNDLVLWNMERHLAGKQIDFRTDRSWARRDGEKKTASNGDEFTLIRPQNQPMSEAVVLVSAEDPAHEVELAAGKILQLVQEKDYRFRDISVIVRNLESYEHLVRYIFDRHRIPYFLDIRRPIAHHPLTRMIQSAVGALAKGYDTRWMLRYMKSGLTAITESAADQIENYVLAHGIDKNRWLAEWRYRITTLGVDEDDPTAPVEEFDLKAVNRVREDLLRPLKRLAEFFGVNEHGQEQTFLIPVLVEGLLRLLRDMKAADKLTELSAEDENPQIHRQIWDAVMELFEQLRITLAGRSLTLDQFHTILTDSFAELTVGVIPSSVDQVLVGAIDRTRHPDIRAGFVLGFNEGVWPQPPDQDVVLTDADRVALAWQDLPEKANLDRHYLQEQYYTYIAFTRPSDFLWVSFARRSLAGVPLPQSRYFRRIEGFCGKRLTIYRDGTGARETFDGDAPRPMTATTLISETVTRLRTLGFGPDNEFWTAVAAELSRDPKTRPEFRRFVEGLCDKNHPEIPAALARQLYPPTVNLSQIESFYRCPFQHFARYALNLKVTPRYRLEPTDLGQFRHQVMAESWKTIVTRGEWRQLDAPAIHDIVGEKIEECAVRLKSQVLFSTARNRYILERTRNELTLAIREQLRALASGDFTPTAFEERFEHEITVDGATYRLVGRIDRIDVADADGRTWVMIIDYKSRMTAFKLQDWLAGTQLQLPGYLWAATLPGRQSAGAVFLPLVPQRKKSDGNAFTAAGLVSIDALPHLDRAGSPPYGIRLKKDGQPDERGPVAVLADTDLAAILRKTHDMIETALQFMAKGEIGLRPYYDGHVSVCPVCEMGGPCRFDPHVNRYRSTERMGKEEVLARIRNP